MRRKTILDWPLFLASLCALAQGACGKPKDEENQALDGIEVIRADPSDAPLRGLSAEQRARFLAGDAKFDEAARASQGLGPLFIRSRCSACHEDDTRGPGSVQKFAVVEADGYTPGDQSALVYGHTTRNQLAAGAVTGVTPPEGTKVSTRFGPAVFGRGYIEAVDDDAIEDNARNQEARTDGISGRINYVTYHSQPNPLSQTHRYAAGASNLIGRFGVKARIAVIDDFVADAYQGDMGLTSPMRPEELPNPDGLADDDKPGPDISLEQVELVADYVRVIDIPKRAAAEANALRLFEQTRCDVCHTPSLPTRADYPIPQLAGIDAPIYSDLLIHDMGTELADGLTDESAGSREWRTAPLMGLRHLRSYLHDGRATTVAQAIEAHAGPGSEANDSIERYRGLSDEDREALLSFVDSL